MHANKKSPLSQTKLILNRNWSVKSIDYIQVSAIPDTQAMMAPQLLDIPENLTSCIQYHQYVKCTIPTTRSWNSCTEVFRNAEWNTKPEFFLDKALWLDWQERFFSQ